MAKSAIVQVKEASGKSNPKGSTIPPPVKRIATNRIKGPRGRYIKMGE